MPLFALVNFFFLHKPRKLLKERATMIYRYHLRLYTAYDVKTSDYFYNLDWRFVSLVSYRDLRNFNQI